MMRLVLALAGLVIALGVSGCGGSSGCGRLKYAECPESALIPCGCFRIESMRGGLVGGDQDLPPELEDQYLLIRPDGAVEFYRGDTLRGMMKYEAIQQPRADGKGKMISLVLDRVDEDGDRYSIRIEDSKHIWYGPIGVMDAFFFGYVRDR